MVLRVRVGGVLTRNQKVVKHASNGSPNNSHFFGIGAVFVRLIDSFKHTVVEKKKHVSSQKTSL